ncbi:MAG: DUF924 family protein [Gemmatimonadetes bacterium]|nr:DUF924 family protein [Gemmatimonadota bacterium]
MLEFWLGRLRTAADASLENWRNGMLKWRVGPFARSAEDQNILNAQRQWCEQMHREGQDRFFADPVWETCKGRLAKLIVLDQFSRSVYRGTPLAYANDSLAASMAWDLCAGDRELSDYNVVERLWIYISLSHAEDLKTQELSIEKSARWSIDLVAEAPPDRRRINQFVSWSLLRALIEHAESLLLFDRFPHRNAILLRPHRGGEPRYLTDTLRPLWSFTQPPDPDYFALLGALYRIDDRLDEDRITRGILSDLLRAAGLSPEDPASPMDIFRLTGGDVAPYPVLFRHLRLPEHAGTFDALRQMQLIAELTTAVRGFILKEGEVSWPPRSAKHSVEPAIDVAALRALVRGDRPPAITAGGIPVGNEANEEVDGRERARSLKLVVRNDIGELDRIVRAIDGFADLHRFPPQDRFQVQLCVEEILVYLVERGHADAGAHRIEFQLEMNEEGRDLAIQAIDSGQEVQPLPLIFQPGADTILEETVVDGLGLHLLLTHVDELRYRREDGRNYLSATKSIGR